jgi:hypothetical protein
MERLGAAAGRKASSGRYRGPERISVPQTTAPRLKNPAHHQNAVV